MAELIKVNKKSINDPLYTPVVKFLKERIAELEINGPLDELELARERYTGIVAGDLVIENPVMFPDGITRVCFVSRKTGFARVDVDIIRVPVKEILDDFSIPLVEIADVENLKTYVKANPAEHVLLWCKWLNTYGVLLSQQAARTIAGPMAAFGDLFFNEYTATRESLTTIDYDTLESGTVKIADPSFGQATYPLFIYELVLDEANIPEITSNLPATITTQRGKNFVIPNTYWFNTTTDITTDPNTIVELTTGSGYTIPKRSSDLLSIEGETIYGSATSVVNDDIIVRVTYTWNNRPVKKTFKISVVIEKDTEYDLTFEITPNDIMAAKNDVVEVSVKALYEGTQVTIAAPTPKFISEKGYGDLIYQETLDDGTMIYSGTIIGQLPALVESDNELYTAEFSYDHSGQPVIAPAYINMTLVKPEALPKFELRGLTSGVRGYLNDSGLMEVSAFYGDTHIPATDLGIKPGIKGTKQLIRFDSVVAGGINYTLIKDDEIPGSTINDTFEQRFVWIGPNGIRNIITRNINVEVKKLSAFEVVPVSPQPLIVTKYQSGPPPFKLMVNGEDVTRDISGYSFEDPINYIRHQSGNDFNWMVLNASIEEDTPTTVTFKFKYTVDGTWEDFTYDQQFVVKKWESANPAEPDFNTKVVAIPYSANITGLTDEDGYFDFMVYNEDTDITATAVVQTERTIVPTGITFKKIEYVSSANVIRVSYSKNTPTSAPGKIYVTRPGVVNPTDADTALVSISTNVTQSRILILKDYQKDVTLEVDTEATASVELTFAGGPITLTDPNLTWRKTNTTDTTVYDVTETVFQLVNDVWRYVDRTYTERLSLEFTYTDPQNSTNITKVTLSLPVVVVYPAVAVVKTSNDPIMAAIWDTGVLPINVQSTGGSRKNFNSAIITVLSTEINKYISLNKLNWSVIWAEKEVTTFTLPLEITYEIGESGERTLETDVVFTLEEWDQITFGGDWNPKSINGKSGTHGEVVSTFVYKGADATQDVVLDIASSTIPETFILTTGSYVEGKGLVSEYDLQRGGTNNLSLVYVHTPSGLEVTAVIPTVVQWADGLNIVSQGSSINGFWQDDVPFNLVMNCSGEDVLLNDPNMVITITSGVDNPITLASVDSNKVTVKLVKGGEKGTTYNYSVDINLSYTDALAQVWTKTITVPASIRVSDVLLGVNPEENVKVWDRGEIKSTLVDERGRTVPIESISPRGTNTYVAFIEPKNWYVTSGNESRNIITDLGIVVGYSMGGNEYAMDVDVRFNIARYDGKQFVVTSDKSRLEGVAGSNGVIKFNGAFQGASVTGLTLDKNTSIIPPNLIIGDIDEEGNLPYTLIGQATDNVKFVILRPSGAVPPVINVDKAEISLPVVTTSSDEEFTLVSHGTEITVGWMETGTLPVSLKYGDNVLAPNAPGVTYTLAETASKSVSITGANATGVILLATRSGIPATETVYPEDIIVTYEVGSPTPKTAQFSTSVTISTGVASINNNDLIRGSIWDRGSFSQNVKLGEKVINSVDHYESLDPENTFVEFTAPRSWEIIGGEEVVSVKDIPMRLYYRVDESTDLLTLDYTAQFELQPYTGQRFYCEVNPTTIEAGVDQDIIVNVRPIFKDKDVVNTAIWKKDLSIIPPELEYKSERVVGVQREITFTGKVAGTGNLKFVFWSPEAGSTPADRDVWTGTYPVKVMGDLGLEIGTRDNLLVGKHSDTGVYNLQLLFGGIPLNIQEEITAGTLTVTREAAIGNSSNAGVLNPTNWHASSFDYALSGPVSPGKTVMVSDFLNFRYMYGGTPYTRRVEIPEEYTTSAIVPTVTDTWNVKIWDEGTLAVTSLMCDGVDLKNGWTLCEDVGETPNGYVTFVTKEYEVVNADIAAKDVTIPINYVGTYRNWSWNVEVPNLFKIAAWDQITFSVETIPTSVTTVIGGTQWELLAIFKYKGVQVSGGDWIDFNKTDFKGLFELDFSANISGPGGIVSRFYGTSLEVADEDIQICWRYPQGINPGVEHKDFAYTTLHYKAAETPLTLSGWSTTVQGGKGDVVSFPLTIKLGATTLAPNNPGITITPENETIFKVTARGNNNFTGEATVPLTDPETQRQVNMTVTYLDPTTQKVHVGTYVQPFKVIKPADYPKVTASRLDAVLWQRGKNPTTVMSGAVNVSDQCEFVSWSPAPPTAWVLEPTYDGNPNGDWYQVISRHPSNPSTPNTVTLTMTVLYKGELVTLVAPVTIYVSTAGPVAQMAGTITPTPFELGIGVTGELRFNLTYRGAHRTDLVLNLLAGGMVDYIQIDSNTADGDTTVINYTGLATLSTAATFVWDLPGTSGDVESGVGQNRLKIFSNVYNKLIVTHDVSSSVKIWDKPALPFKVTSGSTDITKFITLSAVSTPRVSILTPTNTSTGPIIQVVDCPTVEDVLDVTYTFNTPVAYGNRTFTVTIPTTFAAWDQVLFNTSLVPSDFKYQVALNGTATVTVLALYKGAAATVGAATLDTPLIASSSDNSLQYQSAAYGGGWVITCKGIKLYKGTVKIGFNYTGPGSTDFPIGTLGKNYAVQEVPLEVFENALKFYPNDIPPAGITGNFNESIAIQSRFQFGLGPIMNPNNGALTPTVPVNVVMLDGRFSDAIKVKIIYNNKNDDVTLPVTIKWTYNAGGTNYTRVYDQLVTVKGTNAYSGPAISNVQTVTGNVWSKGPLPFTISLYGTALTQTGIKSIAIDSNPYVTAGTTLASAYQITDGTVEGTTTTVTYRVTVTDGVRDWVVVQDVVFNINPYDGTELIFTLVSPALDPFNNGVTFDKTQAKLLTFRGTYRGNAITDYTLYFPVERLHEVTQVSQTGWGRNSGDIYIQFTGLNPSSSGELGKIAIGVNSVYAGGEAIMGKNCTLVDVPIYCYDSEQYYPITWDDTVEGEVGEDKVYPWNFTIRKGITKVVFGSGTGAPNGFQVTPIGIVEATGVYNPSDIPLRFVSEIEVPTLERDVEILIGNATTMSKAAHFPVKTIQHSVMVFPTIEDVTDVTARINDKGNMPFKVMHSGQDITADITSITIASNSYIDIVDKQWHVYHADTGNSIVLPEVTITVPVNGVPFTLKQTVKFTVLGWNGSIITATASNFLTDLGGEGYITVTGDYSGQQLAGNLVLDADNSNGGGLITIGNMEPGLGGSLAIKYTGLAIGSGNATIRLNSVYDSGNQNPNSDFIILTVPGEVLPNALTPNTGFMTGGEGNYLEPTQLTQQVLVGDILLENDDPDLFISLSDTTDVVILSISKTAITYSYVEDILEGPKTIEVDLKFTYKGLSELTVSLMLMQQVAPNTPFVTNEQPISVVWQQSYAGPFTVKTPR